MSVSKGNAGEHLVMAELLFRGFDAYWADRGNPNFDVACTWNPTKRATRLRVKTTSNGSAIWTAKKNGLFNETFPPDDFVVVCDLAQGIRGAIYYIVPTPIIERVLTNNHREYVSKPSRNGQPRNGNVSMRAIRFFGEEKTDNPGFGYHVKFAEYRESWDLLK